ISAELVDARSDRSLWAESYQRAFSEVLNVQNQVALAIVDKVKATVSPQLREQLSQARSVDPAAHEAYLKGQYYFNKYTEESGRKAIAIFETALEIDSTFAEALAGESATSAQLSGAYVAPADAMPRARELARRALALDPNLAAAYSSFAFVRGFYDWQ